MSQVAVRERPIIFSSEMVRALLDGRKTQTRRVILRRGRDEGEAYTAQPGHGYTEESIRAQYPCPYGQPGDRLWVRCGWWHYTPPGASPDNEQAWDEVTRLARWRTDLTRTVADVTPDTTALGWKRKPSIHMPRWASRLTLELTEVRVQRVQEISEQDAVAEGVEAYADAHLAKGNPLELTRIEQWTYLWNSLNESRGYGWDANPWVWALSFRVSPPAEGSPT